MRSKDIFAASLVFVASLGVGCSSDLESGLYLCEPDQPGMCPSGWLCQRRGAAADWRCYAHVGGHCGDGSVDSGEECDGTAFAAEASCASGYRYCRADCTLACTVCGDGVLEATPGGREECDDGAANSDVPDARCRPDCQPRRCGDGIVDVLAGEACDDSSTDGCTRDCRSTETCGNGHVDPANGEQCDDGNRLSHDGCASTCVSEVAMWREWIPAVPDARFGSDIVYDAARGTVLLFSGGNHVRGQLSDTWEWTGTHWLQRQPGVSPPARVGHALAYDAARRRVVLFGGLVGDTWEWNGESWIQQFPVLSPPARVRPAMAYDAARRRVVLFGGRSRLGFLQDTWEWDGTSWVERTPAVSPSSRMSHAMAYDPHRGVVVLFGGLTGTDEIIDETWEWNGDTWTQRRPATSPPRRMGHRMAYDPARKVVVIFGGVKIEAAPARLNDLWEWDGNDWVKRTPPAAPPVREDSPIAYDVARRRLMLFGGVNGDVFNDTWAWDGETWTRPAPVAALPRRRASEMVYDSVRGKLVLFGGIGLSDLWEWDGVWTPRTPTTTTPSARRDHGLAYDVARQKVVLFGGFVPNGTPPLGDTWLWDGAAWEQRVLDDGPPARKLHGLAYDVARERVVLFGGEGAQGKLGDTWEWDGTRWLERTSEPSPSPRPSARLVYDPALQKIVLYGGLASEPRVPNDIWTWDGIRWQLEGMATPHLGRTGHSLTYDTARRSIVMFGADEAINTTSFELAGTQWIPHVTGSVPLGRSDHAFAYDPGRAAMLLVGGISPLGGVHADTWILRYESDAPDETCVYGFDADGDGLLGCADPDCWSVCTPLCSPGMTCSALGPHCGDGTCSSVESCRLCPEDCGACPLLCGDFLCDPGETAAACPGDCNARP